MPEQILRDRLEAAFHCTACGRCDRVCPWGLSPSAAFSAVKQRLIRQDGLAPAVRKALDGARRFAKVGHGFPFSYYESAGTVFWPGCGLAAHQPGVVRRVSEILNRRLRKPVGLVLDCCFAPVHELGDAETALAALREIGERLRKSGVRRVVTGCLNCQKLLSAHLSEIEVLFVLEMLPPELFEKREMESFYLHHPCPTSFREDIRGRARAAAGSGPPSLLGISEESDAHCCGNGGGLSVLDTALANRFLDRIMREADDRMIVTYCTGCQNCFLKGGRKAIHLLECLPGARARRRVAGPFVQWANRLLLAVGERLGGVKLWTVLAIVLLIVGGLYLNQQGLFSVEKMTAFLARFPVLAPLLFLALYAVAPALFLPSIPLTMAAGFFWRPVWGVVFSISGATIGACLPFFLARHLFQEAIKGKVAPERWEWLQGRVARHGWKAVAFTRLIPIFPFNLLNYLFGLTPITYRQYVGSTFVFMLPACIAFVAFGSYLGELVMRGNVKGVVIGLGVAVGAFLLTVALRRLYRKIGN
jgi:uncharacterized membrane protein YdjX (TVP38/TMEM64 family)/Fe-S oxidoreductase